MIQKQNISTFISKVTISLALLLVCSTAGAQKLFKLEKDSIPLMRGFQVSFDLVGAGQMMWGDYGQYEAALRLNLHDQWFPIVELGYGKCDYDEDVGTGIAYKTQAPYFRVGMDWNILKKKHGPNRMYAGFRYAFTAYSCDIIRENLPDPVFKGKSGFGEEGISCSQHWLEGVLGIDAKIYGPLHLGWTVRYKRRVFHKEGDIGTSWYVPGFGLNDSDTFSANFNVIIDI
jgi:hypothetical protein